MASRLLHDRGRISIDRFPAHSADDHMQDLFSALPFAVAILDPVHPAEPLLPVSPVSLQMILALQLPQTRSGKAVTLTRQEFKLLKYLASFAGRVVSREERLNEV